MKKQDDIFSLYNEMDNLLDSIDLDKKNTQKESKEEIKKEQDKIPEMPMAYLNEDEKIIICDTKTKSKQQKDNVNEFKNDDKKNKDDEIINESKTEDQKIENNKIISDSKFDDKKIQEKEKNNKQSKTKDKVSKKKHNKSKKTKKKSKKWIIIFSILDVFALICLFLMYGPISYFRNLWVTSAMTTMNHKYLAYIFFNEQQVNKIMANNVVIEVDQDTNKDEIIIEEPKEEIVEYESIYEEQILKKDEGNDLYKVIDIEGNGYKGHLLVVYDPSKIELAEITNYKYGLTIEQFVKKHNAVAGINAGGFNYSNYKGYTPTGTLIIDGQIKFDNGSTGWGGGIVGFTNDNVLVLTKASAYEAINMGIRDAVSFGPFLIVNGVVSQFRGNGGYGIAPRTAIGQRKDGIVLMLVIDGRRAGHSLGVDMVELTNIMLRYGAYNASNLDGGGSSTIVVGTETLSVAGGAGYTGDRYLPNSWLVMP